MKKLKLLDTFSGIGGFSYAAEKLVGGFETTQFIEIDPYCQKVLKKHWPNVPIHDDIKTYKPEPYSASVVVGGFPCQDLSIAGKGLGITKETRSGLFYELMRVVCLVRPKYIIMENVAAILNNGLGIVLGELCKAGYDAEWSTFRASDYVDAVHHRDRWFCIAINRDFTDTDSIRYRGRDIKRCSMQEWQFLQREQKGRKMGSEIERCSDNIANTYSNGSSFAEKFSVNGKDDSEIQKRKKKIIKSERGGESTNSGVVQQITRWRNTNFKLDSNWRKWGVKPTICRINDGVSARLDKSRIKALGNSLVPQAAAIPLQRVKDLHEQLTTVDH